MPASLRTEAAEGAPSNTLMRAATLIEAVASLQELILGGALVVLDEVQESSLALQQLLQRLVNEVNSGILHHSALVCGRLIVLGSRTAAVESMMASGASPLFARFPHHVTILPFQPGELASLFRTRNVTSGRTRVYIELVTGGYPALLRHLVEQGLLVNDANLEQMLREVVRASAGSLDFSQSVEFPPLWRTVAAFALSHVGSLDVLAPTASEKFNITVVDVLVIMDALVNKYSILRKAVPLLPLMKSKVCRRRW